jgi:Asp/Glu/hydantoin racemase
MAIMSWLIRAAVASCVLGIVEAVCNPTTTEVQTQTIATTEFTTATITKFRYQYSVLTETSTFVEIQYSLLTVSLPPSNQIEYVPYTVYKKHTTTVTAPAVTT